MMAVVHARPEPDDPADWYEICTAAGIFVARIASPASPPAPPFRAAFEFTIDVPFTLGDNATVAAPGEYRIRTAAGTTALCGLVESRDDNGLVHFRLGPDALMMLDSETPASARVSGSNCASPRTRCWSTCTTCSIRTSGS